MKKSDFSKINVKFIPKGKAIKVKRLKEDHIPEITSFNFATVEFGNFFDYVKNKTLAVSRRRKKSTKNFRVLAYEYPKIVEPALKTITKLANLSGRSFKDNKKRFLYQQALGKICHLMAQESWKEGINNTLGLILERGALLTGAFYNYPHDYLLRLIAKRLDYENGEFGLGLSNFVPPKNIKRFRKLHIQEDCIASGDSIAGTILALKNKNMVFNEVQIDAVVITQTGAEFLQKYLKYLGVKKITFRCGGLCFKLGEHFYLRRTKEEGYKKDEFYVGDMGGWSTLLPKKYNQLAWWNKNRLDYKKHDKR